MTHPHNVRITYNLPEFRDNADRLRLREEGYVAVAYDLNLTMKNRLKYWLLPYFMVPLFAAIVFVFGVNDDTLPKFGALLLLLATIVTVWNLYLVQKCRNFFANKGIRSLDYRIMGPTWSLVNGTSSPDQATEDMGKWVNLRFRFEHLGSQLQRKEELLISKVLLAEGLLGLVGTVLWGFGDWFI